MRHDLVEELMEKLKQAKYRGSSYSGDFPVINSDHLPLVRQIISETVLDFYDSQLGKLEAKVKVYEEIISKSNFSIIEDEQEVVQIAEMLEHMQEEISLIRIQQNKHMDFSYETKVNVKTLVEEKE